jgi:hypothetical protein
LCCRAGPAYENDNIFIQGMDYNIRIEVHGELTVGNQLALKRVDQGKYPHASYVLNPEAKETKLNHIKADIRTLVMY